MWQNACVNGFRKQERRNLLADYFDHVCIAGWRHRWRRALRFRFHLWGKEQQCLCLARIAILALPYRFEHSHPAWLLWKFVLEVIHMHSEFISSDRRATGRSPPSDE